MRDSRINLSLDARKIILDDHACCIVCHSAEFKPIFSGTLLKCKNCSFITANMEIDKNLLQEIYTKNYFKGEEYSDYLESRVSLQDNFRERIKKMQNLGFVNNKPNVLEIGCAYGFFAEEYFSQSPNLPIRFVGLDVVPEAIQFAKENFKGDFDLQSYLDFLPPAEPYSDIFMWDVIEHLKEADKFLEKAAKELQEGGRIYITTGDIERFFPKMQGKKWRMIHPPSHIHYFSKRTLTKLLERFGMKVKYVGYPPIRRSVRLIYYSLFILNKKPGNLTKKLYGMIPEKLSVKLNTFDIMYLIAEKQ
jgi:2-polyprenyl-3-methyl-5-hydroxy-6-metoxy-1,4-benzoquinol methylase